MFANVKQTKRFKKNMKKKVILMILDWYPAGKTLSTNNKPDTDRWEFIGNTAPKDIRERYKYKSVEHYFKKGMANPITYVGCEIDEATK